MYQLHHSGSFCNAKPLATTTENVAAASDPLSFALHRENAECASSGDQRENGNRKNVGNFETVDECADACVTFWDLASIWEVKQRPWFLFGRHGGEMCYEAQGCTCICEYSGDEECSPYDDSTDKYDLYKFAVDGENYGNWGRGMHTDPYLRKKLPDLASCATFCREHTECVYFAYAAAACTGETESTDCVLYGDNCPRSPSSPPQLPSPTCSPYTAVSGIAVGDANSMFAAPADFKCSSMEECPAQV